jgi:hypothetical protein
MRNLITNLAIAAMTTALFAVMLGAQVGGVATATTAKTETYAVSSNPYLPIQMFETAY